MTLQPLTFLILLVLAGGSALAEPPAAPSELVSKYASQLDVSDFPAAPAPTSPPPFTLNFSKVYTHRYFYQQTLENHVSSPGNARDTTFTSTSSGDLMVYAEPDQTAQVRLEKLRMQSTATVDGKLDKTGQKAPPTWIGNLNQAGGFDEAVAGQKPLMALLFPVPSKSLAVGESVETPVEFDLPVMGAIYETKGTRRITCTGYVTAGKRLCAKLEQTIALSVVDEDSHNRIDATGKSVSFFAPSEGRFIRSVGVMTLRMTPPALPGYAFDGEKPPPKTPTPKMTSDNVVRIILAE